MKVILIIYFWAMISIIYIDTKAFASNPEILDQIDTDTLLQFIIGVISIILAIPNIRKNKMLCIPVFLIVGWYIHIKYFHTVSVLIYLPILLMPVYILILLLTGERTNRRFEKKSQEFIKTLLKSIEIAGSSGTRVLRTIAEAIRKVDPPTKSLFLEINQINMVLKTQINDWFSQFKETKDDNYLRLICAAIVTIANNSIGRKFNKDIENYLNYELEDKIVYLDDYMSNWVRGAINNAKIILKDKKVNLQNFY